MNPYVREHGTAISRRSLVAGAGLAALAVTGLSACGSGSGGSGSGASSAASSGITAKTTDIPVGGGTIFRAAQIVVTQPVAGSFKAFSDICTHAGCPVGSVTSTINCNCHGSKFSITDGSVVNGPADQPLGAKTVKVTGNAVVVSA